ncbi:MAG: thiamine-phosphate kinase [Candidatus Thorarchaeota archaeon]
MKYAEKTLKDVGEREFLSLISNLVDTSILDFNDDASAVVLPSEKLLVINSDMLVQQTDVLPGMSFKEIGMKVITMSVSDLIAKGAKPLGCLLSVGFPSNLLILDAKTIIEGAKEQCIAYECKLLGGDTNESSEIIIDAISFGICDKSEIISRKGVQEGDLIYTTGLFGLTSIGFKILLEELKVEDSLREKALTSVYKPVARTDLLKLFKKTNIKICMDSSDGLSYTLSDLSSINDIGISISAVPIHPLVLECAEDNNLNPLELVFNGGEEFELVFAVAPTDKVSLEKMTKKLGLTVYQIGEFSTKNERIKISDNKFSEFPLSIRGFQHFV